MLLKMVNFTSYHLIRRTLVSTEVFFTAASSLFFFLQVALGLDDDVRKRKKLMQDLQ